MSYWVRSSSKEDWKTLLAWDPDEEGAPLDFSKDGKTLYILSTLNANAKRLLTIDPSTGEETSRCRTTLSTMSAAFLFTH